MIANNMVFDVEQKKKNIEYINFLHSKAEIIDKANGILLGLIK